MTRWLLFLVAVLFVGSEARTKRSMRYITWNVADNKQMRGSFDPKVVRQLLGVESLKESRKAFYDIYAISMQEDCFRCNTQNADRLANVFISTLHKEEKYRYELVGHMATRVSRTCESLACGTGQHGTTIIIVIAKKGIASLISTFHTNKCRDAFIKNSEKGIATVKFELKESGSPTVCVSALHLDSESPAARRSCFKTYAHENEADIKGCQMIFYAGDYNTRTAKKGGKAVTFTLNDKEVSALAKQDEMVGRSPYGGQRLIDYVSSLHRKTFKEPRLTFYPTYSLRPIDECRNQWPCYRGDRPASWTDRIICTSCYNSAYYSLPIQRSDHEPVIGIYSI